MEKYIPYEKLSKKEKRKADAARRNTWGEINPVTRKPQNSKAYNRNKARSWKRELHESNFGSDFLILPTSTLRAAHCPVGSLLPPSYEKGMFLAVWTVKTTDCNNFQQFQRNS